MRIALALTCLLGGLVPAAAQPAAQATAQTAAATGARPMVANGQVVDRALTGGLAQTVSQLAASGDVAWIGYAVPLVAGDHRFCCFKSDDASCCHGCTLEPADKGAVKTPLPPRASEQAIRLELGTTLVVMARLEGGRVERVRTFSDDCRLDAGGRAVHWLTNVRPADSVRWLSGLATASTERRLADGALTALAFHAEPAALDWLIGTARTGGTAHLRGQALFWLAQRAGDRAVGAIADAVERDPDTHVKRQAVFALSQLPRDEGVPRLIELARRHSNMVVRKQAFFWLGQSKDPRALQFFSEILQPR